jgi:D-amino peptidase
MKVYISADIEGVAGIASWDEAMKSNTAEYRPFQEQMTREVRAACEGALAAGATEILVKDAHGTGRNIDPGALPRQAKVIRGWSGHPYMMMQELEPGFAACLFVGYHAEAGSGGNPMAHTYTSRVYSSIRLDGAPVSEFLLNSYTARREGVPCAFLSGDAAICESAARLEEGLVTVATTRGIGASTLAPHPETACESIRQGVERALSRKLAKPRPLPSSFALEVTYRNAADAYRCSFYPGARLRSDHVVALEAREWLEVLTFLLFGK